MKKLLLLLPVFLLPFLMIAQPLQTQTTYFENFDNGTPKVTSSNQLAPARPADWMINTSVQVSSPNSFHTPAPTTVVNCTTDPIPINRAHKYVYLKFDHICKIHQEDAAYIYYRTSTGRNVNNELTWTSFVPLTFNSLPNNVSDFYYGSATNIVGGKFTQMSYGNAWVPSNLTAIPNNTWWRTEFFDLTSKVVNDTNEYFNIQFRTSKASPTNSGFEVCAGWFVDNIDVTSSLTEIIPPKIDVTTNFFNRDPSARNNPGPYTVKATISDNDTVNIGSIKFYYTETTGALTSPADTLITNITQNSYVNGRHVVKCEWTIPEQCYETKVKYHIYVNDTHGTHARFDTNFTPYSNAANLCIQDAAVVQFFNFPFVFMTDSVYNVKVGFCNKAKSDSLNPNHMTSLKLGWSINGVVQTPYTWTGDLCLDQCEAATIGSFSALRDSNYIKVFVMERNGVTDNCPANNNLIIFDGFGCDSTLQGNYSFGTPTSDFPTLQKTIEKFKRCGLSGHVVLNMAPGTYSDFNFTEILPGQSENATITFQSATGNPEDVMIIDNGITGSTITLNNVSFYKFKNLTIEGKANTSYSRGVYFTGGKCADITIANCIIRISGNSGNSQNYAGISRMTAVTTGAVGDEYITITGNTITGAIYGVLLTGSTQRKNNNVIIDQNRITATLRGISTSYTNVESVSKNIIGQADNSTQSFTGVYIERAQNCNHISKNRVSSNINTLYGLNLNYVEGTADNFTLVSNNQIIGKVTQDGVYGIELANSKYIKIVHNSSYLYSTAPYVNSANFHHQSSNQTTGNFVTLKNNIFFNASQSATNQNYPISLSSIPGNFVADYNDYYSIGNVVGFYTVPRNTLPEWQAAVGRVDSNSVVHNLNFISPTDSLVPDNFNGLECLILPDVLSDIRDHERYSEITYMGAYTYPIPDTNLAIVGLVSPIFGTDCPLLAYPIAVSIKNAGGRTINFGQTPTTIQYSIINTNNNVVTTGTYTIPSGIVPPLQTMAVTVLQNFNIDVNVIYQYTFAIHINNDAVSNDDTLRGNFELQAIKPFYEEIFSNVNLNPIWTFEQVNGAGNWTVQSGEGVFPTIAPNYGTGRLFFNSKVFSNVTEARAIMPLVMLNGSTNPILEFWFAHDNSNTSTTYNLEGVTVKISTNGGTTFNDVVPVGATSALIKRGDNSYTTPGWKKYTIDLSPYVNNDCINIAFYARSRSGGNINIDRIRIRNHYPNDMAVNTVYALGETSTQNQISSRITANVSNDGTQNRNNVNVTLHISGANTYTETFHIANLSPAADTTFKFNGTQLQNNGLNTVTVSVNSDNFEGNNQIIWRMNTTDNQVAYANDHDNNGTATPYFSLIMGSSEPVKIVNRFNIEEELVISSVKVFIVNATDAIGKRFKLFVADANGNIRATSREVTITGDMIETWVNVDLENFALTNVTGHFYAGIEMIDAGYYLGAQEEAPIRDSVYYYFNGGTSLTPVSTGRIMIGVTVEKPIYNELALLRLVNPSTNCDLVHEQIKVNLNNNGSRNIMPGTVFNFSVNNSAPVTETLNDTIFSHSNINFTFNTPFDFNNNQVNIDDTFNIKVWVNALPLDRIHFNDTLQSDVISLGKAPKPTVMDTVVVPYRSHATLTVTPPVHSQDNIVSWYTNGGFEKWNYVFQGDTFITPLIYFDTTYYATTAPGTIYNTIVGTSTQTGTQPMVFTSGYSRGKILYSQSEIGQYGPITKISIYVNTASTDEEGVPMKLYIKQTDLAVFPIPSVIDWNSEIADAQLIYDGVYRFEGTGWHDFYLPTAFNYQEGNIVILAETNCLGTNCGNFNRNILFRNSPVATGYVLYKNQNSDSFSGNYTSTYTKKWNMKFEISDLDCQSEKVPIYIKVPNVPNYDVEMVDYLYPLTACTLGDEYVKVTVRNCLNKSIPAGKVKVEAVFNGTVIYQLINEDFAPLEVKEIIFDTPFDFRAPLNNTTFNYMITTDLLGEATVHRGNTDTLVGNFISKHTDIVPAEINYLGDYTQTFTVRPDIIHTTFYFYRLENDIAPFYTGASYTTVPLYDSVTYWVSAKTNSSNACQTKKMKININVPVPLYDIITNSFVSPISYQCGVMNPNIKINVGNTAPVRDTIPAGVFSLKADFVGTNTASVSHVISQPVYSAHDTVVTFTNTVPLGSTTQNNVYNYTIYSNPVDPAMYVYRKNDTIRGQLLVPANPVAPVAINIPTVPYGLPYTVTPNTSTLNYFYFFDQPAGGTAIAQGSSFTTAPIFSNPTTYYYSGRISQNNFSYATTLGTGTTSTTRPFKFDNGYSVGAILYTQDELGNTAGRIDTISLFVETSSFGEIPVKMYLKNDTRTSLPAANYSWTTLKAGAQLIFDANTDFNAPGWFNIAIPGGFDYTGGSLILLTEHACGASSCVTSMGVNPLPSFKSSTNNGKVIWRASDDPVTSTAVAFTANNTRINTKFAVSYTCESPRAAITIGTQIPQKDLAVIEVVSPTTPNDHYTANESVTIKIKNMGSTAATGYKVGYIFNGQAPVEEFPSGSIATGTVKTHTFAAPLNLSAIYFPVNFVAYVVFTGDAFSENDTIYMNIALPDPCISRAINQTGADISNFKFAGIDNGLGTPIFNYEDPAGDSRYTDFTQTVAPAFIVQGQFYPISITNSFSTSVGNILNKYVYIDLNRDNQFTSNELVFVRTGVGAPTVANPTNAITTGTVNIADTALPGLTRMRIICSHTGVNNACTPYNYGETEDYAVLIGTPFNHDLGAIGYYQPVGEICADQDAKIKMYIKNYGNITQNFTENNQLVLTATVTGAVGGTYTTTISSGSIAPDETMTVAIEHVNFAMAGNYNITTTLSYAPDQYAVNNSTSVAVIVPSTNVLQLPFTETFDVGTSDGNFPAYWTLSNSIPSYTWTIHSGLTPNAPNAGPEFDHTLGSTLGKYAYVGGRTNNSLSNYTTLTLSCINLHYNNGYPTQLDFWKHVFGNGTAVFNMIIEVGTGDNFTAIDTLSEITQTSNQASYDLHSVVFEGYDEVAKIKIKMTNHRGIVDPAIDDINIKYGRPDMGIEEIVYPIDFSEDGGCLVKKDSIRPVVIIKNFGLTPVTSFEIIGVMSIGNTFETHIEMWNGYLRAGESFEYQFENNFTIPRDGFYCQFQAKTNIDMDDNPLNNIKTVTACTEVDIESYEQQKGVVLGQNVPNPAYNNTRIPFLVPESGEASVKIYSPTGQLLYSESKQVNYGENYVDVNVTQLANGIYFYTLYYKDVTLTKKMLIQR